MDWLFPSVVATFTGTIALALIYTYLGISENCSYIKKWALGWWIYALRFIFSMFILKVAKHPLLLIGNQGATLISGVLLLWGTYEFLEKKMPKIWALFSSFIGLWIIFGAYAKLPFLVYTIPTFTFLGIIYIWTGVVFLRAAPTKNFGSTLTGYSFILWGVHKLNYPFLNPVVWFAPWGYLIASLLEIIIAMGMLLTYFQKNKSDLINAQSDLHFTKTAVNRISDSAFFITSSGHFSYVNQSACRKLGYSQSELLKMAVDDLDPNFPADSWAGRWEDLKKKGTIQFETTHKKKDGTTFPVEVSDNFVNYNDIEFNCAFVRDISERKILEERLVKQIAEFEAIFNSITDAIVFVDKDRRVVMVNPAFEMIFGYGIKDVEGKTTQFIYANPEEFNQQGKKRYNIDAKLRSPVYTIEYRRKDGSTFPSETLGVPVKSQNGEIVGFLGVIRDISEKFEFEKEKEKLETQLRQAYKMEAIGTMAGGIAHDFNNMLAIIIGNADMALDDIPKDNFARYNIEKILKASNRATDLVRQILTFSHRDKLQKGPLYLCNQIREDLKLLRSTIPTTISIVSDIDADCRPVLADPTQINQLLMNLCNNAVHAMDEKGALTILVHEIDATTEHGDRQDGKPGSFVRLTVTDTGIGMDKGTMDRIFDPFFTTKEVGKGTGMGLSVVHGIVENHGARITVESELGKGSSFHVDFPITEIVEEEETTEEIPIPTGTERILFVDDEQDLAEMGGLILENRGYKITVKTNSAEALELFKSGPDNFDLVVTDQTMPNLSGSELSAELLKVRPDLPIILCTGYSAKISEENAKKIGIREFCTKPLDRRSLAMTVRKVLDEKKA